MVVDLEVEKMLKIRLSYSADEKGRSELQEFLDCVDDKFELVSKSEEYESIFEMGLKSIKLTFELKERTEE